MDTLQYYYFGTMRLEWRRERGWGGYNLAGPLMWTYLIGPILAFLPKSWRASLPFAGNVQWRRAAMVSGVAEWVGAIAGVGYWYLYAMTRWVDRGVSNALAGKLGPGVKLEDVGGVALTVWWMHPLTWLLCYLMFEGIVRFCAAAFG